ncbi:glycosyltransferase family 4 protein [Lichenihabitans sp. Uapishka_5]|uniref:glycosyltransferase family 4 protein n=1 Tax=Lichenihabitans sp. Uapishka_5 TaxID=3037302 RepID=UPI0029E7DFD9|nr:glycosyltransferase family 4 protein [Lichenihabitans sp. Uapishka_5]MDX7952657.1 glycosyltransferase family 4 protein [Lichenihabitans sp. Uapishka_5]
MRVTVCVNGTFRYPDYIRHYAEAGALGCFHFAHRRGRDAAALGLRPGQSHNVWPKHYLHGAAFRAAPGGLRTILGQGLCDAWQAAVLRRWQPCDSLEVVIGAVADRVIARARRDGTPVLGHPVTSHPTRFRDQVDRARDDLGLKPEPRARDDAERRAAEIAGCDLILADSRAVARSFTEAGIAEHRVAVLRPGFDAARFHPRAPSDIDRTRFLVVCIGLITPRKGQHVLLRAWRRLALPNAELVLIGTPGRDAGAVLVDCPPGVTRLGHVEHSRLRRILARASCLVLPSAEDGFGQAALEAMACGVPVIVSDAVGAAELVRPGRSGFVVPALQVEPLMAALERLYRDRALAVAMGQAAAVDAAAASFGWPAYVGEVLALHRGLIDRAGRPYGEAA